MSRFFVAGLVNIETTLAVDGFPLHYYPVGYPFFGLHTSVSGVGFNISAALTTLGNSVDFVSLIGSDDNGTIARHALIKAGIDDGQVLDDLQATAQSVVLYAPDGRRQIHVDLKDIQDHVYPVRGVEKVIQNCDLAVICNINFARPLLDAARKLDKWIATDMHAISDLDDEYNRDFMAVADILFLSDEALSDTPENTARTLMGKYNTKIIVIGLGDKGALLAVREDDFVGRFAPVYTRPVVNTIGAGDALFSAFLDRFMRTKDPYDAIRAAGVFASYKIGETGAAEGFLTSAELESWLKKLEA